MAVIQIWKEDRAHRAIEDPHRAVREDVPTEQGDRTAQEEQTVPKDHQAQRDAL